MENDRAISTNNNAKKWIYLAISLLLISVFSFWGSNKYHTAYVGFTSAGSDNEYEFWIQDDRRADPVLYVKNKITGQDVLLKEIEGHSAKIEDNHIVVLTEGFFTNREDIYSLITGEKIDQISSRVTQFSAFLPAILVTIALAFLSIMLDIF